MDPIYSTVKDVHGSFRWVVLALAVLSIVDFAMGWIRKKNFGRLDNTLSLLYMIACDLQLMLGLTLYFFLSPTTQNALQFGTSQFSDPKVFFFAVEHPATMILGIACAHIGRVVSKKATTDESKFKRGAIWFALSLILILARMPW